MILQIINFIVTVILVYLLWNKKYITNIHLTNVFDKQGELIGTLKEKLDDTYRDLLRNVDSDKITSNENAPTGSREGFNL